MKLLGASDIFAQHMKFVASVRILTEELTTLASGFEVEGGQLRNQVSLSCNQFIECFQLLIWLNRELDVLKKNCGYELDQKTTITCFTQQENWPGSHRSESPETFALPQSIFLLSENQKLLRSFISFCTLHAGHSHKLASVLMELLVILLNVQTENNEEFSKSK